MISSSKALSSIEQAIRGVRRDEDRLTKMLATATEDAARLRGRQAEAYRALARLKMEALARDEVVGRLDNAEKAALKALKRQKDLLIEVAEKRVALDRDIERAEKERDERAESLADAVAAVEAFSENAERELTDNPDWMARSKAVGEAEAKASAADEKAKQSESDREEKRKPYDADMLFTYLWERGYGTSDYSAGPLARYFDGKVARLIGYQQARPNYHMLNEIPKRLREHAERLDAAVDERESELEQFERRYLEETGIVPLEAAMDAAEAAHAKADSALEALEQQLEALDQQQDSLLDLSRNTDISQALQGLVATISREDLADLRKQALATETREDDTLVKELRDIGPTLARREAEAEEVRKTAVDLAKKRVELEKSRQAFHRSGYNNPRGQFSGDIGSLIEGIVAGALTSGAFNDALGKRYRPPRRTPSRSRGSFGGGISFPKMPSRPSMPRPSRPSRPSGGFRTGGGF